MNIRRMADPNRWYSTIDMLDREPLSTGFIIGVSLGVAICLVFLICPWIMRLH